MIRPPARPHSTDKREKLSSRAEFRRFSASESWVVRDTLPSIMSPTVFRDGRYRFYFNSREEDRIHVHVESSDGQLKIWLEPRIELAENHGIPEREVTKILRIVENNHGEIEQRWHKHRRG